MKITPIIFSNFKLNNQKINNEQNNFYSNKNVDCSSLQALANFNLAFCAALDRYYRKTPDGTVESFRTIADIRKKGDTHSSYCIKEVLEGRKILIDGYQYFYADKVGARVSKDEFKLDEDKLKEHLAQLEEQSRVQLRDYAVYVFYQDGSYKKFPCIEDIEGLPKERFGLVKATIERGATRKGSVTYRYAKDIELHDANGEVLLDEDGKPKLNNKEIEELQKIAKREFKFEKPVYAIRDDGTYRKYLNAHVMSLALDIPMEKIRESFITGAPYRGCAYCFDKDIELRDEKEEVILDEKGKPKINEDKLKEIIKGINEEYEVIEQAPMPLYAITLNGYQRYENIKEARIATGISMADIFDEGLEGNYVDGYAFCLAEDIERVNIQGETVYDEDGNPEIRINVLQEIQSKIKEEQKWISPIYVLSLDKNSKLEVTKFSNIQEFIDMTDIFTSTMAKALFLGLRKVYQGKSILPADEIELRDKKGNLIFDEKGNPKLNEDKLQEVIQNFKTAKGKDMICGSEVSKKANELSFKYNLRYEAVYEFLRYNQGEDSEEFQEFIAEHTKCRAIPSEKFYCNIRAQSVLTPVGYLAKLGFGNANQLLQLLKTGQLKGVYKTVEINGKKTLYAAVDIKNPNNQATLNSLRSNNKNVIQFDRLANLFNMQKRELKQALLDDELKIIPEYIFLEDKKEVYIDLADPKSQEFCIRKLLELQIAREHKKGEQEKVGAKKAKKDDYQTPAQRLQSLRMKLVWLYSNKTRITESIEAKSDTWVSKIITKKERGEALTPKEYMRLKMYYKDVWESCGAEEFKEAHAQASGILKTYFESGIDAIEDEEARTLLIEYSKETGETKI